MREKTAGGVADDNKARVIGVVLECAVEKDGGTREMDAMEPLECQEKDMYAQKVKYFFLNQTNVYSNKSTELIIDKLYSKLVIYFTPYSTSSNYRGTRRR